MAFRFARPASFSYEAGQHVTLNLVNLSKTDVAGGSRVFTLASAPHEAELTVATRMRDTAFKRALKELPIGAKVSLTGPRGNMTLHADPSRPAIFLAGGIGITPFLSMARQAAHAKLPHQIILFYSNRRPQDAAYLSELRQIAKTNSNFKLIATMTAAQDTQQSWNGETSVINEDLLRHHVPDLKTPIYYCAGPGQMVGAMQDLLRKIGVARSDMRFEQFLGY
jgi:ferredoxin-NADP reductase